MLKSTMPFQQRVSTSGCLQFARRSQDEKNMQDARNLREKKGAHEIMWKLTTHILRVHYFLVQLFYRLITREKHSVSCIITTRWVEMRDTRNLSHEAAKKIQNNPYTRVASSIFFASHRHLANCLKAGYRPLACSKHENMREMKCV